MEGCANHVHLYLNEGGIASFLAKKECFFPLCLRAKGTESAKFVKEAERTQKRDKE